MNDLERMMLTITSEYYNLQNIYDTKSHIKKNESVKSAFSLTVCRVLVRIVISQYLHLTT